MGFVGRLPSFKYIKHILKHPVTAFVQSERIEVPNNRNTKFRVFHMNNVREHLEKAFAEAMYNELFVTAGLIAAALETIGVNVESDALEAVPERGAENVVCFPVIGK